MTTETTTGAVRRADRMTELDFFVGVWDAPGVFHDTPFRPRTSITMEIDAAREQRGRWLTILTAELPTPDNPAPLTARYVWGFDSATNEFTAEWFDSNGGRASQRSPGWDGDRLVFSGAITMDGATVPLRDTFTRRGDDGYHHLGEIDLGEGWLPVDEEDAVRRPGQA